MDVERLAPGWKSCAACAWGQQAGFGQENQLEADREVRPTRSGYTVNGEPGVKIKKAVITAAGEKQRLLPLQTLIDRDGEEKSVLGILIELALAAHAEDVCVVVWPGDEGRYGQAAAKHLGHVRFVPQPQPLGYGHAVYCARGFLAGEPFLHLVGDHMWATGAEAGVARELVALAESETCATSAVQVTRENLLPRYGAVGARRIPGRQGLYRVESVVEKPTPTEAEQRLITPGLRAGYYLCFFGMHVFTPALMELLEKRLAGSPGAPISLSPRSMSWRSGRSTWRWKPRRSATISARATDC